MLALFLAAALAGIDPGPKLSEADDFREMVDTFERQSGCEAAQLYRCAQDDYRIVVFRCNAFDAAIVFVLREEGDWVMLRRPFVRSMKRSDGPGI